ncbi:MAG: ribosome small subunit-dependent GTPase A [Saprospiraceae bacterium]|nr:ribosome small subunit-dependent GTPase A [Saprospiraceae bacterium]MCB9325225.1 ribosome small subunit-dependent GTPase A [Lewinellaceae bacterium]
MGLHELGYNERMETFRKENKLEDFEIGRISQEHKERYIVSTAEGELDAEITGNMRFAAQSREDFPAVGDWVALSVFDDLAIIHKIFPRYSTIKRQAVGHFGEVQIIATNIDFAFLIQTADRDFNINRLERYLTLCYESKVRPIIVLNKTDLVDEAEKHDLLERITARIRGVPVVAISNETKSGYETLMEFIEPGKTYCLLGSSGVGKSTLMNNLSGKTLMKTDEISQSSSKGRHVTSHRELVLLENGGILIDNPGMREVGIADAGSGLEETFDDIVALAQNCKFKDCTHTSEIGCAVIEAVEAGEIEEDAYENFLKLEREKARFESSVAERRKRDKAFGKMVKNMKKDHKKMNR